MDLTDLRILRTLGMRAFDGGPRSPSDERPQKVAQAVGLSRETVRQRLAAMRSSGVLLGFEMVPNLRLLGLSRTTYHLQAQADKKAGVVEEWRERFEVSGVYDFLGTDLCIDVIAPESTEPRTKSRKGSPQQTAPVMGLDDHPRPDDVPSKTAWRLILALRRDALRPLEEVVADVGCTARTARRLVRLIADRRQADVVAIVDPSKMNGLVASLLAIHGPLESRRKAASHLADHTAYSWVSPTGTLWVATFAATANDLERLRAEVAAKAGVERVDCLLPGRVHVDPSSVDRRLAELAA